METIADALVPLSEVDVADALQELRRESVTGMVRTCRGSDWLAIKTAALEPTADGFLQLAIPFLAAGRLTTATLWYAVALDLVRAFRRDGQRDRLWPVSTVITELSSGDGVPVSV